MLLQRSLCMLLVPNAFFASYTFQGLTCFTPASMGGQWSWPSTILQGHALPY